MLNPARAACIPNVLECHSEPVHKETLLCLCSVHRPDRRIEMASMFPSPSLLGDPRRPGPRRSVVESNHVGFVGSIKKAMALSHGATLPLSSQRLSAARAIHATVVSAAVERRERADMRAQEAGYGNTEDQVCTVVRTDARFEMHVHPNLLSVWNAPLQAIRGLSATLPLKELMMEAARLRDAGHSAVTFSPKVALRLSCFPAHRVCNPVLRTIPGHPAAGGLTSGMQLRQVFIPLTRLCRNECGYCTFALPPAPGRRTYMTVEEVLSIARTGAAQGCTEALFTLGKDMILGWEDHAAC